MPKQTIKLEGEIKRIASTVDKEGQVKIQVVFEYPATNPGKERVADLVKLQGHAVTAEIRKEQMEIPFDKDKK